MTAINWESTLANICKQYQLDDQIIDSVIGEFKNNLFPGATNNDHYTAALIGVRARMERDNIYGDITAALLLHKVTSDVKVTLDLSSEATAGDIYLAAIERAVKEELLADKAELFDTTRLASVLKPELDVNLGYLGLQTLYDRYFIHVNEERLEIPCTFFMRVAMGLAIQEDNPTERAIEFYNLLSSGDYLTSTPTLFNSYTRHSQLSSCYLSTVPDDLAGIYDALKDDALLSKYAGGLGNDWTPVRAMGAHIKGTNGKSQGVVPFLKVANDTAVAVNQGGKRKGAMCAYLETWHMDIEEFVELRKNTGDDRRRTHDMNTANWIPDLFMKRVQANGDWTLFSPNQVPDLHDLYGKAFEERYEHYERRAAEDKTLLSKTVRALDLWRKMLGMLFETGHPWLTFKDPCNIRSPQQHAGVVHSSNLCTEITLNTSPEEIAVCNLGSVNLAAHIRPDGLLDVERLGRTVRTAVRMLDNVIDINYYSVDKARNSNFKHRPVGLGLMGFQDALYKRGVSYASHEAVAFADATMEAISYFAIKASCELAKERGTYKSYEGSLWSKGILPIDSVRMLAEERGSEFVTMDQKSYAADFGIELDWATLRADIAQHGMRNSNVMAIAPTATISNIVGVTQSIEPTYQNLYVKSNLSGEFTIVNPYLVSTLKSLDLWDQEMVDALKVSEGSVQGISYIPQHVKELFLTAFEVGHEWLIKAAAGRQKWIDQSQSLNLYIDGANGRVLDSAYKLAWLSGLKTTYYLRALSATTTEKSTVSSNALNAVSNGNSPSAIASATQRMVLGSAPAPFAHDVNGVEAAKSVEVVHDTQADPTALFTKAADVPLACSIDNPDCEACQ